MIKDLGAVYARQQVILSQLQIQPEYDLVLTLTNMIRGKFSNEQRPDPSQPQASSSTQTGQVYFKLPRTSWHFVGFRTRPRIGDAEL